jgi:hypothetical protein
MITFAAMAQAVMDHASDPENYELNGWDIVVETVSLDEIQAQLRVAGASSVSEAIAYYGSMANMWLDRTGPRYPTTYCSVHPTVRLEQEDGESAPS